MNFVPLADGRHRWVMYTARRLLVYISRGSAISLLEVTAVNVFNEAESAWCPLPTRPSGTHYVAPPVVSSHSSFVPAVPPALAWFSSSGVSQPLVSVRTAPAK